MGEDLEKRTIEDRRKQLTPFWNLYTFFGRRRRLRRKSDQEKGRYLDRYSPVLFFFIVLILALNILDSLFTMIILDLGGREFNPIVRSIMALHGDQFWIWKFLMVSGSLVLLFLHRGFKLFRGIIIVISSIYLIIVLYQVFLITHLSTPAR
jgi:hypothetical protein